jgi:hypothetical protein
MNTDTLKLLDESLIGSTITIERDRDPESAEVFTRFILTVADADKAGPAFDALANLLEAAGIEGVISPRLKAV